ncbi:MAG: DUF5020 family protein [Bacteroidaceae bacterium]|jgi:hypothetical protein|nr:DUF5020 family protein [Bacteroidaceae bacterium]
MKKLFLLAAAAISMTASAQVNIQLHYDFGRQLYPNAESNRGQVTTTVEMFKADRLGSTYFFVDMDYSGNNRRINPVDGSTIDDGVNGNIGAYWEVSRDFTFYKVKRNDKHSFSAHIEYDGGLSQVAGAFQQAMLVGPAWSWHNADFKKTFTLQVMYKQYFNSTDAAGVRAHDAHPSFQITPIWNITFANDLCTFSGFADLWYGWTSNFEANDFGGLDQKKGLVFLTEPQFWFHVVNKGKTSNRLSVGTEIEISNNFVYAADLSQTFFVNPTIALKWDI